MEMPATAVHSILLNKENAHDDPIYCCAWTKTHTESSGDKKIFTDFIVTGGLDCLIKIWKLVQNKLELMHTLQGHSMAVVSVAVSPDGFTLASTSLDCTLVIWDMVSGQKVHVIPTGALDVWKVAFSPDGTQSPDGKYLASGAVDGTMSIFNMEQDKMSHTFKAHTKPIRALAFTPKSDQLLTASDDGNVKIFDVFKGVLLSTLGHKCWSVAVCVSADGVRAAAGAADGTVRVALTDGLKVCHTFAEHTDTVWGLQFNAEGNKLLSVSKDRSINIYKCPLVAPPMPAKTETPDK